MGLNQGVPTGATELDPDESEGLLVPWISTRRELDEYEQANIQRARVWLARHKRKIEDLLTEEFIRRLHREMYGEVWAWAGQFRRTERNIGVDPIRIGIDLRQLLDDTLYWVQSGTYATDEIALRAKHRLVSIHCFPNGNGRHSRLFSDVIATSLNASPFTWGATTRAVDERERYLDALRRADRGDLGPLFIFARS